jgi:copper resistance protein B
MSPWRQAAAIGLAALVACMARAQGVSELEHVAPDPPQSHVHDMPYREMAEMMGMDDRRRFRKVMFDRLEWQEGEASAFGWDAAAWYGGDYHKLWLEAEGERAGGRTQESRVEASWDRIVSAWWSLRAGVRHDGGIGPSRDWLSVGVAGLAPGFVEVEALLHLGEGGRTAFRLTTERDVRISRRLVLQPEAELAAHGRDDPQKLIGAGLSVIELGLRLRYEWRRELAPYVGIRWVGHFGDSADLRRAAGEEADELQWVAGLRAWF